ncbi:MAG: hypothetical protein IK051_10450 [Rhodocyclaceae bacterium]|nr:hypothetical protein [Rhodocyclaceae bacterium]
MAKPIFPPNHPKVNNTMNTAPIPDREELARCARRAAFDFSQAEKTLRAWLNIAREMSAPTFAPG